MTQPHNLPWNQGTLLATCLQVYLGGKTLFVLPRARPFPSVGRCLGSAQR